MQAQSAYRTSNGNVTLRQGGYAIFNARLGYQIDEIWTAAVNVNNVFDRRYYQGCSLLNGITMVTRVM